MALLSPARGHRHLRVQVPVPPDHVVGNLLRRNFAQRHGHTERGRVVRIRSRAFRTEREVARHHGVAARLGILDARHRQPGHLDHDQVDVLRVVDAGVLHRPEDRSGDLPHHPRPPDLLGHDRLGAGDPHDQPLVLVQRTLVCFLP